MSWLKRLFGGGDGGGSMPEPEPIDHNGYAITPAPEKEGGKWRIAATIRKEIAGETKTHLLIRADTLDSEEEAVAASTRKARQMIDEQGDRLFD